MFRKLTFINLSLTVKMYFFNQIPKLETVIVPKIMKDYLDGREY